MTRLLIIILFFLTENLIAQKKKDFKLEKIVFESSPCDGICPTYDLQIDSDKTIHLHARIVYKDMKSYPEMDTTKMGYFQGVISDSVYVVLTKSLKSINIDKIQFDNSIRSFGAQTITIIIYYNGKRKVLTSQNPPKKVDKIISTLFEICDKSKLIKTYEKFKIE